MNPTIDSSVDDEGESSKQNASLSQTNEKEATSTIHESEWKHVAPTVADDDGNNASSELKDTVSGLPSNVVKELLSLGDCKSSMSSFRIRLIYNHTNSSKEVEKALDCNNSCKRRKTDSTIGESDLVGENPFNSLLKSESSECCKFLLEKVGAIVP
ncbi:putative tRNA pseudouridine synthase Pus10 [Senna tora]|uniref:Putative tRNA pseudouridine synthase Pus10 n=1 Tax=Senna tora TaxID=362788 RepID=A0A834SX14_9FABA|nr:putative tRNA pseudouridine synthase Pus10 [Senna tora]